jgi:putative membrane-bound dehydrogenase-like protein
MYRFALLALVALPVVAGAQPPATHSVKLNGHTFTLPVGFTIELAVGADLAPRPITCAFDEKGRLYVADSSGSNANVKEQLEKKPHRILRLEDTNGDGTFDKQTVFVKNVMFPEGTMWLNGSLFVSAPPQILKFTDTDDDGVADKEEVWFDGKTLTGCANDLHGPYRGPDGFIYWCKGAFAKQEYTLNGKKFGTRAAHVFRAKPDGSGLEPVMTGGMDNPVDVAFAPNGDLFFTTTFFQRPANGRRDGLVHAIYGGVYGKDHDPVYEHPWTGPDFMPVLAHMGPAAPAGLHRYEGSAFGKEYANNLFACQFNMRKVSRHELVPTGSSYETRDSNFVVSDNLDFHPTDVIEDADGSLLIVDTGGWYKLCCPTSQLVKPDVTGAIYRVRRTGAPKVDDARGLKLDWSKVSADEYAKRLRDSRPAVRMRAADALAAWDGDKTDSGRMVLVRALAAELPQEIRLNALWGLSREKKVSFLHFRNLLRHDEDDTVRAAAAHVLGLHRHKPALPELADSMARGGLHTRRACAAALGRIGDSDALPALALGLKESQMDRALHHAITFALIEIGDAKATAALLKDENPAARRAALAALEHMPNALDAAAVLAELDSENAELRDTAWWIAGRHAQWGDKLGDYFKEKLAGAKKSPAAERAALADRLVKFAKNPAVQELLGAFDPKNPGVDPLVFGVMARSGVKALPKAWEGALLAALLSNDDAQIRAAVSALRALPLTAEKFTGLVTAPRKLSEGGITKPWSDEIVFALLSAAPPGAIPMRTDDFGVGLKLLHRDEPAALRASAADALARAKLSPDELVKLAGALKTASALELPKLVSAFDRSKDEKAGLALVAALRAKEVRPAVRAEMVKPILDKYPDAVKAEAEKLYAELAEARKGETERLNKLLKELPAGDVRRGQVVFNSAKTNCIACHKVGYVGGTAGPDLTRIGGVRTERDLLEAVLYPSASFVRSYEPFRVVTKDDRTLNGVLKKDAPDEIVIVVAADKEERVPRDQIESVAPSTISLMPAGLEQQLSVQEIADLLAFLKACR